MIRRPPLAMPARFSNVSAVAVAVAVLVLGACDKLPDRPDETKFKALDEWEKCRVTATRAIMCSDELIVAEARSLVMDGADEMASSVENELANDKKLMPKAERKQNIDLHKARCRAELHYADAVFACWSIEDCKKLATCVVENSTPLLTK